MKFVRAKAKPTHDARSIAFAEYVCIANECAQGFVVLVFLQVQIRPPFAMPGIEVKRLDGGYMLRAYLKHVSAMFG